VYGAGMRTHHSLLFSAIAVLLVFSGCALFAPAGGDNGGNGSSDDPGLYIEATVLDDSTFGLIVQVLIVDNATVYQFGVAGDWVTDATVTVNDVPVLEERPRVSTTMSMARCR